MSITERKLMNGKTVYDNAFMYNGIRYKKRGFAKKGDAKNWEIDIKNEVNKTGTFIKPCKKSFEDVFTEWMDIRTDLRENTAISYRCAFMKVKKDKISKMTIESIRYPTIKKFFNALIEQYNYGTCKNVLKIFNGTFKHAIQSGYIKENPMVNFKFKYDKDDNKDIAANKENDKTISINDFMIICNEFVKHHDTFNNRSLVVALQIGYYTGARVGEVLALSKDDIDFNEETITFTKRIDTRARSGCAHPEKMKTKTSYAILPLASPLKNILINWFEENPYDNICVYVDGNYISYGWLQQKIKNVSEKLNIPFHFHMLRHTYATNLVKNGVSPAVAKKLLRHSNITTTLNLYTHINLNDEKEALENVFNKQLPQNYPKNDLLA